MSSSALLLNFLNSQYFNSFIAVSYLFRYKDSVGIQHYLCEELKKIPKKEIEFFLPQLVHLLITSTNDSMVLEEFLLDRCFNSMHTAILTLWYLQSYQSDLLSTPHLPSANICNRVLNKCQEMIFGDHGSETNSDSGSERSVESTSETSGSKPESEPLRTKKKKKKPRKIKTNRVLENVTPAIAGIRCMIAGIAAPLLVGGVAQLAVTEGRRQRVFSPLHQPPLTPSSTKLTNASPDAVGKPTKTNAIGHSASSSKSISPSSPMATLPRSASLSTLPKAPPAAHPLVSSTSATHLPRLHRAGSARPSSPSLEDLSRGKAFTFEDSLSRSGTLKKSPTGLSRGSTNHPTRASGLTSSPFTARSPLASVVSTPLLSPTSSTESNLVPPPTPSSISSSPGFTNNKIPGTFDRESDPFSSTRSLDPFHYVYSELTFVRSLIDISTRLCQVPKPARQSSLMAELELLNHNLPADVCLPLWCRGGTGREQDVENRTAEDELSEHHHMVVRIDPGDAVILNSADRVPYLLLVEVIEKAPRPLEDDDEEISNLPPREPDLVELFKPQTPPRKLSEIAPFSNGEEAEALAALQSIALNPKTSVSSSTSPTESSQDLSNSRGAVSDKDVTIGREEPANGDSEATSRLLPPTSTATNLPQTAPAPALAPNPPSPTPSSSLAHIPDSEYAERMRTAAVMLAQLADQSSSTPPSSTSSSSSPASSRAKASSAASKRKKANTATDAIRGRIVREMMALEEGRLERLMTLKGDLGAAGDSGRGGGDGGGGGSGDDNGGGSPKGSGNENFAGGGNGGQPKILMKSKDDPSATVFLEDWKTKRARIRASSPYGHHPNWRLLSVIVKTGADLRQEQFACQIIRELQRLWAEHGVGLWVKYMRILVTSADSGIMETIKNSISIHSLRKDAYARKLKRADDRADATMYTLKDHFANEFGDPSSERYRKALDNFMRSLAGYSLVCYLLQVKDRHNGNILLDTDGHVIHIDFGFMLSNSPGSVGFEMAPFKLAGEYIELLGGMQGEKFAEYKKLFVEGFLAVRKNAENVLLLIKMMMKDSKFPCFANNGDHAIQSLRDRLQFSMTESQVAEHAEYLIYKSGNNVFTGLYDRFQNLTNGIL